MRIEDVMKGAFQVKRKGKKQISKEEKKVMITRVKARHLLKEIKIQARKEILSVEFAIGRITLRRTAGTKTSHNISVYEAHREILQIKAKPSAPTIVILTSKCFR